MGAMEAVWIPGSIVRVVTGAVLALQCLVSAPGSIPARLRATKRDSLTSPGALSVGVWPVATIRLDGSTTASKTGRQRGVVDHKLGGCITLADLRTA